MIAPVLYCVALLINHSRMAKLKMLMIIIVIIIFVLLKVASLSLMFDQQYLWLSEPNYLYNIVYNVAYIYRRDSSSMGLAVGGPGVSFLVESYQQTLNIGILSLPAWRSAQYG